MGSSNTAMNWAAANRLLAVAGLIAALAACAASNSFVLVGTARPAISPAEVKIYSHPPPTFEEIALLTASSNSVFTPGGQKTVDTVIERLKEQAAKLGANGIILEGFSDRETGSLGTGVGGGSASSNSAVGVGVGGSLGIYKKSGQGRAIFVPPQ
jgi:uncharacterized protein YbjQ (UPF0145 family)